MVLITHCHKLAITDDRDALLMITHRQYDQEDEKILKSCFENLFHSFYVFLLAAFTLPHSPACVFPLIVLLFSLNLVLTESLLCSLCEANLD